MNQSDEIKNIVKAKYGEIAVSSTRKSCCSSSNNKVINYSIIMDNYSKLEGYVPDADLGLGCGLPTEFAGIKKGDIVIDLGCGAGNDVFIASALVGEEGKVIGIDFTDEMIIKANFNKDKFGFNNVEFKLGEIENLPIEDNLADVVISNCVLNLVPDKNKAFGEIYRVLKSKAHFCVSDIILKGELLPELKKSAELYAGCIAGAIQIDEYIDIIKKVGFVNVEVKRIKTVELPDNLLKKYLKNNQITEFKKNNIGIFSITVVGYKQ
ncbi:MAG: arsenite methyltransferase [Ignavibacterium sp.]|nr:arsenite methyltransferase [Ignavibacterium sp.]